MIPETEPEYTVPENLFMEKFLPYCILTYRKKQVASNKGSNTVLRESQCTSSQALELRMQVVLYANKSESLGIGRGGGTGGL